MARFRTRARTVDMLGRQQIAGIPTAINELFKNAYDAYAKHIDVDYYRPEDLFVLRDDGLGMTLEDVEEHWLVLGTESKLRKEGGLTGAVVALGIEPREPTGEKGIGRLAIAAIGPQVLLVSRAGRGDGPQPTIASFVNWSMFTLPGISLDEIEVPVRVFKDGSLPDSDDLDSMVDAVRENLKGLLDRVDSQDAVQIEEQLNRVSFDARFLQRRFVHSPLGHSSDTGTQFFIQPTDPMLVEELDTTPQRRRIGNLQRMLMGFTNTMMPGHKEPPVVAEFRDHKDVDSTDSLLSRDEYDSVIGPDEFFTPSDFESADHHFEGRFDEFGRFDGTVSVYGGEPDDYSVIWTESRGRQTECGPFDIHFAYVQGVANESRMNREAWGRLIYKLDSMGGLYIYRNGIRILPYGGVDNDFLGIEQRRSLRAGDYFFSYRRMLGAIDLPSDSSDRLGEKAGREGFRENKAYRQFRAILEHFFIQLAANYFRDDSSRGNRYKETKAHLDRQTKALQLHDRESRERRRRVAADLRNLSRRLESDEPEVAARSIVQRVDARVGNVASIENREEQARAILEAEETALQEMLELKDRYRVPDIRGVGLTDELRRQVNVYRAGYDSLDERVLGPASRQVEESISGTVRGLGIDINRQSRLEIMAEVGLKAARTEVGVREEDARARLNATVDRVRNAIKEATSDFENTLDGIAQRLRNADLSELTDAEMAGMKSEIDAEIDAVVFEKSELLTVIARQLDTVTFTPDASGEVITRIDVSEAMEEELLALQKRAETDLEYVQLGIAIEIIGHEFRSSVLSLRQNIRLFRAWADVNEQLAKVYNEIRLNFEHLDSYLNLFTPLHKRLYRTAIEIKCSEISKYLSELFRSRLERHQVELEATDAFLGRRLRGYPSSFYPVFVCLIDNAIHWLKDRPSPRVIRLDAIDETIVVSDNGPGIEVQDREVIFELGFTRKRGGRGYGLYISRSVLGEAGYEINVAEPFDGHGATFIISPKES